MLATDSCIPLVTDQPPTEERFAIETVGGQSIDFSHPDPEKILLTDIAHGLSHVCRFGGHTKHYYSVAEHALLVHDLVGQDHPKLARAALHHDSHEAYAGDMPTPLKRCLGAQYREIAARLDGAIAEALGIDPVDFHHPIVVAADQLAMQIEATALMPGDWAPAVGGEPVEVATPPGIRWRGRLIPEAARRYFLEVARGYR